MFDKDRNVMFCDVCQKFDKSKKPNSVCDCGTSSFRKQIVKAHKCPELHILHEEVLRISQVGTGLHAMITMEIGKPTTRSLVTFQLDTGAECNFLLLKDHRRTTRDHKLVQVQRCSHKFSKTYTNQQYTILGLTKVPTWCHGHRNMLNFNITEDILTPLVSYRTCLELGLMTINDCDDTFNPMGPQSTTSVHTAVGATDLLDEYKDVFQGLGGLPGVQEHYQMPTIEEVVTRLAQAKKFMVVDAKDGFWQKRLDTESSYKTTFNTPSGRYRWQRMPFGINSVLEVWQRTMHKFLEKLEGVEVIADNFLTAGFGATNDEVDHTSTPLLTSVTYGT